MSEQVNEQISALLDGELPEAELSLLLTSIAQKPETLQGALLVQQTRLCLQGETPLNSIGESVQFSTRIQDVLSDEQQYPRYDLTDQIGLRNQLGQTDANSQGHDQNPKQTTNIDVAAPAANDSSKWGPLFGAGVAAAAAIFAVTAWQSQISLNQDVSGLLVPIAAENDSGSFNGVTGPDQLNSVAVMNNANLLDSSVTVDAVDSSAYTVPEFSSLNVEQPIGQFDDLRQVKYSTYLLQNQVAPQSTSNHLSRYAQQLRATQSQQIFIDPRTGRVVMSISPIEKR